MRSEVLVADSGGLVREVHAPGFGFFLAPAAPPLSSEGAGLRKVYRPGQYPARVYLDNSRFAMELMGPHLHRVPFRRLRLEGVLPFSHWHAVILEDEREAFERFGPQLATFDLLLDYPTGPTPEIILPSAAPTSPGDGDPQLAGGFPVGTGWRGFQFSFAWTSAPRPLRVWWHHPWLDWVPTDTIATDESPAVDGTRTAAFRTVLHPGGRFYVQDYTKLGPDPVCRMRVHVTMEVE